ncbi:MAG: peptide chain release factor-like protein [bacterium]
MKEKVGQRKGEDPLADVNSDFSKMPDADFIRQVRFETFTPGGPGGQHANRTCSGVRVIHIPTGISAVARENRSQFRNRQTALARLIKKIKAKHRRLRPRIPTTIPQHAQAYRRQLKEHRSRIKELRKKILSDSDT